MNRIQKNDIYFLTLIIELYFVITMLLAGEDNMGITIKYLFFSALMLTILFSYYIPLSLSFIFDLIFVFIYGSLILYNSIFLNVVIDRIYFVWLIIFPVISGTVGKYSENINDMQIEYKIMKEGIKNNETVDPVTGFENQKAFYKSLEREMSRSRRHNRDLSLLMLQIKDYVEIKRTYNKEFTDQLLVAIANKMELLTRKEDSIYKVSENTFIVIFQGLNQDSVEIIKKKLKEQIKDIQIASTNNKIYETEFQVCVLEYTKDYQNPLQFKQKLKKEMKDDV